MHPTTEATETPGTRPLLFPDVAPLRGNEHASYLRPRGIADASAGKESLHRDHDPSALPADPTGERARGGGPGSGRRAGGHVAAPGPLGPGTRAAGAPQSADSPRRSSSRSRTALVY